MRNEAQQIAVYGFVSSKEALEARQGSSFLLLYNFIIVNSCCRPDLATPGLQSPSWRCLPWPCFSAEPPASHPTHGTHHCNLTYMLACCCCKSIMLKAQHPEKCQTPCQPPGKHFLFCAYAWMICESVHLKKSRRS